MQIDEAKLNEITAQIIGSSYDVSNDKGTGFLEKVYENCLRVELGLRGLKVEPQKKITIRYKGYVVGDYIADLIVEESVIVEVKHATGIDDAHVAQCLNYLKATGLKVCLIINFGKSKIEIKRVVLGL